MNLLHKIAMNDISGMKTKTDDKNFQIWYQLSCEQE